jgi:hypothetical protein
MINIKDLIVIILIFILYIYLIKKKIEEHFENKLLVAVFSEHFGLGLGDYMRGLIYLYKNCDGDCKIYADYSKHRISNFLENTYEKPKYEESQIERIWSKQQIDNLNNDINFVFCNLEFGNNINDEIREYLLKSFKMKPDFEKDFNETYNKLQLKDDFIVIHIRLDDRFFNTDEIPDLSLLYDHIENNIIPNNKNNVLVMSNSFKTKNLICNKYDFKQFEINPVHTISNEATLEDLKNTLIEFFLISKSKKIYQFSHYHHNSGFSTRISEIYDIELIKVFLPQ